MGLKKLPTIKSLQAEYTELLSEKKKDYAEYVKAKKDMQEVLTAKANVDRLLSTGQAGKREETIPAVTLGRVILGSVRRTRSRPAGAFRQGRAAHLSGVLGAGHQQANFSVLSGSEKLKNGPVCTTGHCLPLLSRPLSYPDFLKKHSV